MRSGRSGPTLRLRIDLHGVSSFGPGKHHTLIRWEWIEAVTADQHGVIVTSEDSEIVLPRGAFGLDPAVLAEQIGRAGSIVHRADIIEGLARAEPG